MGSWSILKCQVLVELKVASFSHESIGQLNTYVSWYRKHMMTEGDNPPVGILLCTQKDHALMEYALAGIDNGLFVSKYLLELPKEEMQRFLEEQLAADVLENAALLGPRHRSYLLPPRASRMLDGSPLRVRAGGEDGLDVDDRRTVEGLDRSDPQPGSEDLELSRGQCACSPGVPSRGTCSCTARPHSSGVRTVK